MNREELEQEKQEIIDELLKNWPIYDHVSFNEFNLGDKLQNNSYLLIEYRDQLNTERAYYEELECMLEKLQGQQYHIYRFEQDEELTKLEIEKYYLSKDLKIQKMKKLLRKQNIRVRFFDACVKGLDRQYWSIKEFRENYES